MRPRVVYALAKRRGDRRFYCWHRAGSYAEIVATGVVEMRRIRF